jgi:1-acyl-sn-glycerol-3-phosphate acyltransferase
VAGDPWLYALARVLLVPVVRLYGRFHVSGAGCLPDRGPAIVVANHPSDVDPILVAVALPRTLHFMADAVQFRRGFVGPVIRRLGAFPVHHDRPDLAALRHALRILERGGVVAVFPEGDVVRQSEPAAFAHGVALLAAHSSAPVIPAAIVGAERIRSGGSLHWAAVRLRFGPAVVFDCLPACGPGDYARMAETVRDAVMLLHDGHPEVEAPGRRLPRAA